MDVPRRRRARGDCSASWCSASSPRRPAEARWLHRRAARLARRSASRPSTRKRKRAMASACAPRSTHPTVWLLALVMFCCQTGSYGLTFWVPTIVKGLSGLQRVRKWDCSRPIPYVAAALGMVLVGWSSDRSGERFLHVAVPSVVGALGFIAVGLHACARARDAGAVRRRRRRLLHARPILGAAGKIPRSAALPQVRSR